MTEELQIKNKTCFTCKQEFSLDLFHKNSSYCKPCDKKRGAKWRRNNKQKKRDSDLRYNNKEEIFVKNSFKRIFKPSSINPKIKGIYQRKGWEPEITLQEMYAEYYMHIQEMKDKFPGTDGKLCKYCYVPLTYKRTGKGNKLPTNLSVDRFNSEETYKKGNVMFCCSRCNSLKNGSTKAMWIRFLEIDKEMNETPRSV